VANLRSRIRVAREIGLGPGGEDEGRLSVATHEPLPTTESPKEVL